MYDLSQWLFTFEYYDRVLVFDKSQSVEGYEPINLSADDIDDYEINANECYAGMVKHTRKKSSGKITDITRKSSMINKIVLNKNLINKSIMNLLYLIFIKLLLFFPSIFLISKIC